MILVPQLLETRDNVKAALAGKEGSLEPKLDGHRAIVYIDADGKAHWFARSGVEKSTSLTLLMAELEQRLPPNTILDGEEVSRDGEWGVAQSVLSSSPPISEALQRKVQLAVFDVVRFDGIEAGKLPYVQRRAFLEQVFEERMDGAEHVRLIPSLPATQEVYEKIIEGGFEGAVLKHHDAPYRPGARGQGWYRLKPNLTIDLVAMDFEEGCGKASGMMGSIVFGQYKDGELVERGGCGTGFSDEQRIEIWERREELRGEVFEARYFGCTGEPAEASPRTAAFLRWRDDKLSQDCVWEVLHR